MTSKFNSLLQSGYNNIWFGKHTRQRQQNCEADSDHFLPGVFLFSRGQPREIFYLGYGPIPQVNCNYPEKLQIFSRYGKCATPEIPRVERCVYPG